MQEGIEMKLFHRKNTQSLRAENQIRNLLFQLTGDVNE